MDQHDKWKRLGLFFHVGLEPMSGKVLWLKVWRTNRNPKLILGYFLDAMEELGSGAWCNSFIPYPHAYFITLLVF